MFNHYVMGLLFLIALVLGGAGYGLASWYFTEAHELEKRSGVLATAPEWSYDPDNREQAIRVRIELKGDDRPLVIPGKLLPQIGEGLSGLQEGDTIQFHVLPKGFLPQSKFLRPLYSLQTASGKQLLTLENGLAFARRPVVLIACVLLFAPMVIFISVVLRRPYIWNAIKTFIQNLS